MGHVKSYPFHNLHQYLQMNGFNHNNSSIVLQYMDEYKLVKYLLYLIRKVILQILGISPFMSYVIFIEKKNKLTFKKILSVFLVSCIIYPLSLLINY